MSAAGTKVGQMHRFSIGDIIQMKTTPIPLEDPPRNWGGLPFSPRDFDPNPPQTRGTQLDTTSYQFYRVTRTSTNVGGYAIPDRNYYTTSAYVQEDHRVHIIEVEPMVYNFDNFKHERIDGVHWHINVTHMSLCQNKDGMGLRIIDRLVLVDIPPGYISLLSIERKRRREMETGERNIPASAIAMPNSPMHGNLYKPKRYRSRPPRLAFFDNVPSNQTVIGPPTPLAPGTNPNDFN